MSPDANDTWYLRSRGKVLGPFSFRTLEVLRNQGRLAKFDEVSRGDRRNWVLASSHAELFPSEAPAPGPEPEPAPGGESLEPVDAGYSVNPASSAGAAEAGSWYYMGAGGQSGPLGRDEIIRLAATGAILPETLVWTSTLGDWTPAQNVPALGYPHRVAAPATPSARGGEAEMAPSSPTPGPGQGGVGLPLAGFLLGLLSLLAGLLTSVTLTLTPVASRNREVLGLVLIALGLGWGSSGLLAVTFGTLSVVRAGRDGAPRRGFGLGLSGLILGFLALAGLLVLIFVVALGVITIGPGPSV